MNKKANKPHKQNKKRKKIFKKRHLQREDNTAPREGVKWACAVLRGRTKGDENEAKMIKG